jgi:enoyl-CoA hydratase/carnithine racemase
VPAPITATLPVGSSLMKPDTITLSTFMLKKTADRGYGQRMDNAELIVDGSEPGIVQLVLHRPHELNAWTLSLEKALFGALDAARVDPAVRVVVITGSGRGFCAGAPRDMLGGAARPTEPRRQLRELVEFPKPIVAAVNGPAIGLGLALAIACDIRICDSEATLATAFAKLGLVAEHGTAWLLPRLVGRTNATDLLLSGRTVTGAEAEAIGLVNRAVAPGTALAEALSYARTLVETCAPQSWATIKKQLVDTEAATLAEANDQSIALMKPALASMDHREAVAAWREKRPPQFSPLHQP